jgi:hypothetical protein
MYDELFAGWKRLEKTAQTMNKKVGVEVLYLSPKCSSHGPQFSAG